MCLYNPYVFIHTYLFIHAYICECVYTYLHMCLYIHMCLYNPYVFIQISITVLAQSICVYTYIFTYIHTFCRHLGSSVPGWNWTGQPHFPAATFAQGGQPQQQQQQPQQQAWPAAPAAQEGVAGIHAATPGHPERKKSGIGKAQSARARNGGRTRNLTGRRGRSPMDGRHHGTSQMIGDIPR